MYTFKEIDQSLTSFEQTTVHYDQSLNTSSLGLDCIKFVSGSISQSYWSSFHVLFYTSGSPILNQSGSDGYDLYDTYGYNFSIYNSTNPQHVNKFHGYPSSSVFTIPQHYYGEKIKTGTFKLTDKTYTDNDGNNPIIKDDGYGNLYSTNAYHSQSLNSLGATGSVSSSVNYVGNIFYDWGFAVLTETASWSGSVNYPDFGTNYDIEFQSSDRVYTREYSITIEPEEFNYSLNHTLRCFPSWSQYTMPADSSSFLENAWLCPEYTGSHFRPYITEVNLYNTNNYGGLKDPVITAKLPKPLVTSRTTPITLKIKLDT